MKNFDGGYFPFTSERTWREKVYDEIMHISSLVLTADKAELLEHQRALGNKINEIGRIVRDTMLSTDEIAFMDNETLENMRVQIRANIRNAVREDE